MAKTFSDESLVAMSDAEFAGLLASGAISDAGQIARVFAARRPASKEPTIAAGEGKGIITLANMPGMGTTWLTVESAEALCNGLGERLKAFLSTNGNRLKAARVAYQGTPEYAAAKGQRSAAMKASAARK